MPFSLTPEISQVRAKHCQTEKNKSKERAVIKRFLESFFMFRLDTTLKFVEKVLC